MLCVAIVPNYLITGRHLKEIDISKIVNTKEKHRVQIPKRNLRAHFEW